jgi:hypothetical protein
MILASRSFLISLSITGSRRGLIGLSFCLKGIVSFSRGILC